MYLVFLQFLIFSPDTLWNDSFSDDNWNSNPQWYLRVGDANVGGPQKLLFLYGDANSTAKIGTTGDGKHKYKFYMTFKTKIFDNPSSNIERNWLIVREDTLNSYRVVFYPDTLTNQNPGTIYIQKNDIYVHSALSKNVIKGSKFFVAMQASNDSIYVACSLGVFTTPPSEWDLTFNEAFADTISDTLWLGGWDIDTAGRGVMWDDFVVQTPISGGIEDNYIINPVLTLSGYPNPFTKKITIRYSINDFVDINEISLSIYDISGRLIRSFPLNNTLDFTNEVSWNGMDKSGNKVTSGIYFCILRTNRFTKTLKFTYVK